MNTPYIRGLHEPLREAFLRIAEITEHLRHINRFSIPEAHEELVKQFTDFYIKHASMEISAGAQYFRARLHKIEQVDPYPADEMGAPPHSQAIGGRINPDGIPHLYVADSQETALSEVRPWTGARVSVGMLKTSRLVRCIDLTVAVGGTGGSSDYGDVMRWVGSAIVSQNFIRKFFASPAHNRDRFAYLPSQLIAERFKRAGFGALRYESVLHEGGTNVVFFETDTAPCESVNVFDVSRVKYEYKISA